MYKKSYKKSYKRSKCDDDYIENWSSTDNTSCRNIPVICPTGSYCPTPSMTGPTLCPIGSYCPTSGMTDHKLCPVGSYCPDVGMKEFNECPVGSFCSSTKELPTICPIGSYCPNKNMTVALKCPVGSYCPNSGMANALKCPTGTLCLTEGLSNPSDCPPGSFCYYSYSSPITCPTGFYCPTDCSTPLKSIEKLTVVAELNNQNAMGPNPTMTGMTGGGFVLAGTYTFNADPKKYLIDTGMLTSVKIDASLYYMASALGADNWQTYGNKVQFEMYINDSPTGLILEFNLDGGTRKTYLSGFLNFVYYTFPEKQINVELILQNPVFVTTTSYINFVNKDKNTTLGQSVLFSNFKITTKTKYLTRV